MVRATVALTLLAASACSFQPSAYSGPPGDDADVVTPLDAPLTDAVADSTISGDAPQPNVVAVDNTNSVVAGYATTQTMMHTVGAGADRLLLVSLITDYAEVTATAITYGGSPLTLVGAIDALYDDGRVELWKLVDPPVGTASVNVTVSGTSAQHVIGAISLTGVGSLGSFQSARAGSGEPTISLPGAQGDIMLALMMWNGAYETLTDASGQNRRWAGVGYDVTGIGSTKAGTATTTFRWTSSDTLYDTWAVGAIAIKP